MRRPGLHGPLYRYPGRQGICHCGNSTDGVATDGVVQFPQFLDQHFETVLRASTLTIISPMASAMERTGSGASGRVRS